MTLIDSGRLNVLLCFVLCVLPLAGCRKAADTTPDAEVSVEASKPTVGPISEQIESDAVLAPLAQAALTPRISAPVKRFYVQRGSRVKAGQLLVSLEDKDLQATALDNRGTLQAAQANYQQTVGAQVPEEVQKAELDLAQANANLELNRSIVNGRKQLFQQGAIPGRDLDTAQAALVQTQAAYDAASKHLQSMQSVSRATLDQASKGQLTSAQGKLMNAEAMVSYSSIRTPIAGVVTDRPLFAGEMAAAGTPVVTVMDTSSLLAKLHLSQAVAQRMKVGDAAAVAVPGVDDPVKGMVSLISPALDPGSTTVEIWVKLPNSDGKLKSGTPVHVTIAGRTIPNALEVPTEALQPTKDGGTGLLVISPDGTAHMKTVQVGVRLADKAQILSGIGAEDNVIVSGGYGLDEGTKVKAGGVRYDDAKPSAGKPGDKD
jgi:RND family efflux transporter MFP subunit